MIWNIVGNVVDNETGEKAVVCKSVSGSKYVSTGDGTMRLFTEKVQKRYTAIELDKDFVRDVIKKQNSNRKTKTVFECSFV